MKRNKRTLVIGSIGTLVALFVAQPSIIGKPASAEENSPLATYAGDDFNRTATGDWGSANLGGAYATAGGTASNFSVNGSQGIINIDTTTSRQVWLPEVSQQDQAVTVRVATDETASGGNLEASVLLRRVDINNYYRFEMDFTPSGRVDAAIYSRVNGSRTTLDSATTSLDHAANTYFWIKAIAQGTNPTTLNMKVWQDGTSEPSAWTLSATSSTPALQVAAPPGLHANVNASASSLPVTFSWDDLTITDGSTQGATPTPTGMPTATETDRPAPTATSIPPTSTPNLPTATATLPPGVLPGLSWQAEDGVIAPPFVLDALGSNVSQPVETLDPALGGRASYRFNITTPGAYVVKSVLDAPDTGADSLFLNIDGEPVAPTMIWDVSATSGFQTRTASWRGNGTWDNNQYVPKVFNLSAGIHELIIRGREADLRLDTVSIEPYSASGTPVATNTPAPPTSTNTPIPPASTNTPVPPTSTNTPVPPASTNTPVPPTDTFTVTRTPTRTPTTTGPSPTSTPTTSAGIVWSAGMETGNLSEWTAGSTHGGSYDSGDCIRPPGGVSTEQAHSGRYSMKMTIDTSTQESGCRQFRHEESLTGNTYYYGAWYYIPQDTSISSYWNVFQFKSETDVLNDPFWVLDILNRSGSGPMNLVLRWKGVVPGPHVGEGTALRYYRQTLMDVPVGRWFHVEAYLRQSSAYTGQITVWQDGVQIFNQDQVTTKYVGGDQRWSVNSYSDGLSPSTNSMFIDDATVSTRRVGP